MPLVALHLQAQQGHAQACPQSETPRVVQKQPALVVRGMKTQYTAADFQRNNKSGRLR